MLSSSAALKLSSTYIIHPKPCILPGKAIKVYHRKMSSSVGAQLNESSKTLIEYVGKSGIDVGDDLVILVDHLQYACKKIAALIASPFPFNSTTLSNSIQASGSDRDSPKPLDILSNDIILSSLQKSGKVAVVASEENDVPTWFADDAPFVVVMDPLDGSRNIDASIPTGTIFGVYNRLEELDNLPEEEKATLNSLQSGSKLVAAGYVLYSSATIFCVTFGSGVHSFTLDHSTGDFILTHPSIKIPSRGQIYSVNDARYFDWPDGLRRYIDTVRQGKGRYPKKYSTRYIHHLCYSIYSVNDARYFDWPEGLRHYIDTVRQGKGRYPKKYSARYICSLVADFHRTLLYGGIAMNPRDHLRLVYEANPLSYVAEQAGGKGSDGKSRILGLQPAKLHQRLPLFLGSPEDIDELESYGNIQQKVNPGYEV